VTLQDGLQLSHFSTSHFLGNLRGICLVFDLTNRDSFSGIRFYADQLKRLANPTQLANPFDARMFVLVGTKSDMIEERQVGVKEARKLADEFGVQYFETSAKTGQGVEQMFLTLASMIFRNDALMTQHGKASAAKKKREIAIGV
jgi:GTPase SAR1 family protein